MSTPEITWSRLPLRIGLYQKAAKISEQQARLKELEQKKLEAENSEIVDIVRGMSISLTELPLLFEKLKDGGTLGQTVPKSEEEKKEEN